MPGGAGPLSLADAAVDVPTAKELIEEIHRHVDRDEVAALVAALERKAEAFAKRLSPEALAGAGTEEVRLVLRSVFAVRRKAGALLAEPGPEALRERMRDLLHGTAPLAERFDRFCASLDLEPLRAAELAGELLHFSEPRRYWLSSRWIWNPETRTGALPLVLSDEVDLEEAEGPGDRYELIGLAMRSLDASPEAASFRPEGGGSLGTDVFLVCVYGVYMHTVLGLKMSQEFNAVIPPLPDLARRLLGIHKMEV